MRQGASSRQGQTYARELAAHAALGAAVFLPVPTATTTCALAIAT